MLPLQTFNTAPFEIPSSCMLIIDYTIGMSPGWPYCKYLQARLQDWWLSAKLKAGRGGPGSHRLPLQWLTPQFFFLIFGAHNSNDWHTWLLTNNRKPSHLTSTVISTETRLCDSDAFNSRDRMEQGLEPASASLNIGLADREL